MFFFLTTLFGKCIYQKVILLYIVNNVIVNITQDQGSKEKTLKEE